MKELFGYLTAYEMRNEVQGKHKREVAFKSMKKEDASGSHNEFD